MTQPEAATFANALGHAIIRPRPYRDPDVQALLHRPHTEQRALHGFADPVDDTPDTDHLPPAGLFLVAYLDEKPVACGGWRQITTGEAEIKRMYVQPELRGHQLGQRLLRRLERDLARLAETAPGTRITWAVRGRSAQRAFGGEDADELPARGALGSGLRALVDTGRVTLVTSFGVHTVRRTGAGTGAGVELVSADGRTVTADRVVAATGFRPDHGIATELRLDLDPILGCTRTLADLIDPNEHSCGTVPPHGYKELGHPEPNYYAVGMKSYGRAPTFLMATGYEQVRSIAAALAGDFDAADDVQLDLPETGVCSADLGAENAARAIAARLGLAPDVPGRLAAATTALLPTAASTSDAVRAAAAQIGLDEDTALEIAALAEQPGVLPTGTLPTGSLPTVAGLISLTPSTGGSCCS